MTIAGSALGRVHGAIARAGDAIPWWPVALFLRVVIAHPFFLSGQTKIEGPLVGKSLYGLDLTFKLPLRMHAATIDLFADEYKIPLLPPVPAAYLSAFMENVLPILIVLGLATRLSALGLLGMTAIIQIFVYPDAWWTVHSYWAAILVVLVARGPGALSLDHWILGRE
jgi:putative oxidoreductase